MTLVKSTLETKIKEALTYGQTSDPESNPEDILNETSKMIANAIHEFITSGIVQTDVTVNLVGQTFNTTLGPGVVVPGAPATGKGTGKIK
jgi:hypothetical protein